MVGFLVWLIILIGIAGSVAKGKKQGRTQQRGTEPPKRTPQSAKVQPRKNTVGSSYKPQTPPKQKWQEKPKTNIQTTRYQNKTNAQKTSQQEELESVFDKNKIVAAAKANTQEVERDNNFDAENEHLMDAVYDAIVKGPKNTMEFQRDFIAEGMDMLNSFDL